MLRTVTARPVGVVDVPSVSAGQELLPYSVLYPYVEGALTGPAFAAPEADARRSFQVTCVGRRSDQAEALMDRVRSAILGRKSDSSFLNAISVTGMRVIGRESLGGPGQGDRSDDRYTIVERFALYTTPA